MRTLQFMYLINDNMKCRCVLIYNEHIYLWMDRGSNSSIPNGLPEELNGAIFYIRLV